MKKKLMMVAVLLGALSLGACVDDNESASVTSIRNAKAQQLEALAALSGAQAEAELIVANAEAALKQAKAAYQQALANAKEAEIERLNAEHAITLEKLRAQAEAAIAKARYNAAKYEQDLLDLASERVQELYQSYSNQLNQLVGLQDRQLQLMTLIAQNEAGLVPLETQVANQVAYYQDLIDQENFTIELYREYEGADLTELRQDLARAQKDKDPLQIAYNEAQNASNEAYNAYYEERPLFDPWSNEVAEPLQLISAVYQLDNNGWYVYKSETHYLNENTSNFNNESIQTYSLNEEWVENQRQSLESEVEWREEYLGTPEDESTEYSLYGQLAAQTEARADALEADPDADVTSYDETIARLRAQIGEYEEDIENSQNQLDLFESLVAAFTGESLTAYNAAIEELETLYADYLAKQEAYMAAEDDLNEINAQIFALYNSINNVADVEQLIREHQNNIASYQESQQEWQNRITNTELATEQYNQELDIVNRRIEAIQAILDSIQQQIEAAINSDEETPDTPAEEETPAA